MRRRSVAAPILLIALGVVFLANNLRPDLPLSQLLGLYRPFLLIAWGFIRLIEVAAQDRALEHLLAEMCPHVAAIASADVVSVYVREISPSGDSLVMRGNVGFPPSTVGTVSLRMGEGITGLVAECMRPVSVAVAAGEASYKHVPGLGEERFPAGIVRVDTKGEGFQGNIRIVTG